MSYARFSEGDIYVFATFDDVYECCSCRLALAQPHAAFHDSQTFATTEAIIAHVHEHIDVGHDVPARCLERLESELVEGAVLVLSSTSEWLRHKAEYTASLGMSTVRMELEAGNLSGALHALARIAEREEREADRA